MIECYYWLGDNMGIMDYLDKYGDKNFTDYAFNDVDNVILSQLSYLSLSGIVPSLYEKGINFEEMCNKYFQKYSPKISNMIKKMSKCVRYKDAIVYNYVSVINDNMQFGALSIRLNDNSVYVSFEGTDDTMVGWKEDFEIAYNYPVPSQILAVKYINRTIKFSDKVIRLGGHSKGGNLAVCAAMGCYFFIRSKIVDIYNNDGPGFSKDVVLSHKYERISDRIKLFVPKQSIVGMLMYHNTSYDVVRSSGIGILAHDVFTWQVKGNDFIHDDTSFKSKKLQKNINKYLDKLSVEERKEVVSAIFSIFEDNDIKLTSEIKFNKVLDMFKSLVNIDKKTRKDIYELLMIVIV